MRLRFFLLLLFLSALFYCGPAFAADQPALTADGSTADSPFEPIVRPIPAGGSVVHRNPEPARVEWGSLMVQSGRFLGIMHLFRLATEPGTRSAGSGLGRGYLGAIGNMHGWQIGTW